MSQGFLSSNAVSSLFIFKQGDDVCILLLYVDDMLIAGSSTDLLDSFIQKLKTVLSRASTLFPEH